MEERKLIELTANVLREIGIADRITPEEFINQMREHLKQRKIKESITA